MPVTYENVFYDYVLDPLRDIFMSEYNYGTIYIAPSIVHRDPFSIRIWGDSADTQLITSGSWQKEYSVEISLYEIEKNGNEVFHNQFFNDIQRIYQLLVDNAKTNATTLTGSGNNTSSKKLTWVNGVCDDYTINEFVGEEEEIDGLNVCRFNFNCIIIRTN